MESIFNKENNYYKTGDLISNRGKCFGIVISLKWLNNLTCMKILQRNRIVYLNLFPHSYYEYRIINK